MRIQSFQELLLGCKLRCLRSDWSRSFQFHSLIANSSETRTCTSLVFQAADGQFTIWFVLLCCFESFILSCLLAPNQPCLSFIAFFCVVAFFISRTAHCFRFFLCLGFAFRITRRLSITRRRTIGTNRTNTRTNSATTVRVFHFCILSCSFYKMKLSLRLLILIFAASCPSPLRI